MIEGLLSGGKSIKRPLSRDFIVMRSIKFNFSRGKFDPIGISSVVNPKFSDFSLIIRLGILKNKVQEYSKFPDIYERVVMHLLFVEFILS